MMARSVGHPVGIVTGLGVLSCAAACSLLAPSDEEAMAGLATKTDGAQVGDASVGDTSVVGADAAAATDAAKETGSVVCPACAMACNQGQCSGCYLSGAPCTTAAECCGGVCNAQHTCGAAAGACTASNGDCSSANDTCCPGSTCSVERGNRCDACHADGNNCKADTDCCSVNCSNGQCKACLATGATGCTSAHQCCSGVCTAGSCR